MSAERPNRNYATQLACEAVNQNRPLCWFEPFYDEMRGNAELIPWADMVPNPKLVEWIESNELQRDSGSNILVVGCGLGDDADFLARSGSNVTAFDISPTAIAWAKERFKWKEAVEFCVADLLKLPAHFHGAFKLVVEIYTLQVLPEGLRPAALKAMADCLDDDGVLLIICRGRDDEEPYGELPWGVSTRELRQLETLGLKELSFECYTDASSGPRRFCALYRRVT